MGIVDDFNRNGQILQEVFVHLDANWDHALEKGLGEIGLALGNQLQVILNPLHAEFARLFDLRPTSVFIIVIIGGRSGSGSGAGGSSENV